MKKFLIVLACFSLVLPLFALSAFAETMTPLEDGVPVSSLYFDTSLVYTPSAVQAEWTGFGSSCTAIVNGSSRYIKSIYIGYSGFTLGVNYYVSSVGGQTVNTDILSDSSWDGVFTFSSPATPPSDFVSWYNSFVPAPSPLEPVNDGVNTFIGYGGQVLSFLTNNSTLLFLIGLSVGLCLVIPFGVSKIKDLLKGY